jgi:hypothetical protein
MPLTAQPPQSKVGVQEILGGNTAQGNDDLRLHKLDLEIEVTTAGSGLFRARITIAGRTALDDVGNVHLISIQVYCPEDSSKKLPCRAYER